ncbi:unnamed protein product [Clonostachys solani]|uniref:Major facilitator superfamily (MFS) profile domain-containing protein n=1 Tax=Clonostachys solani TaxID=160281 RepID=A0A9N9Z9W4_9HYPO|nr:unnamed protein product [Clonostachys solani]
MAPNASASSLDATTKDPPTVDVAVTAPDSADNERHKAEYRTEFLSSFTIEEEQKIMRKVDLHIVVLVGLIYSIKQIDTNNAALVKVMAIGKPTNILNQLGMTSDQYAWVQTAYYIPYVLLETPTILLFKKMSPRLFQSRIIITWGIILALHAAVSTKEALYALRVLIGIAEAGMFPAIMTFYTCWYRGDELARPMIWVHSIDQFSNIIGQLLAYGMSYLDGKQGLSSWQWVFLLEGVATVIFGIIVYFYHPDYPRSPRTSKWLSPREQEFVELRLTTNAPRLSDKPFSLQETLITLKDPRLWSFTFMMLCMSTTSYGIAWFLPNIVTNLGFVTVPRNLLLLLPGSFLSMILIISIHFIYKRALVPRPLFCLTIVGCELLSFIIFLATQQKAAVYAACILGSMFSHAWGTSYWPWRSSSLKGTTGTAVAFGITNSIGQLGGVIGPQIFRSQWATSGYKESYGICVGALGGGFLLGLLCWYLTFDLETQVRRVKKARNKAAREGRVYVDDEVRAA